MAEDELQEHSKAIASGTFWGLLGNGAAKLISFLYIVYVARMVSQNDVGLFYLALSIIGLFGAWKTFGLPLALTRYVPYFEARKEYGKARSLLWITYLANIVSGIALAALTWFAADYAGAAYQNPGLPEALRLLAAYVLLENLFSTNTSFLQGRSDIRSMQAANVLQAALKLALTAALFTLWGPSLATLCAGFVGAFVLSVAVSGVWTAQSERAMPKGVSAGGITGEQLAREIVPFGLMLTIVSVLWMIVTYADRILLGYFLPPSQANQGLAVYSLAVLLAVNVMVLPSTVGSIFLPVISQLVGKDDKDGVRKAMATAQRWSLCITLPFVAVMVAFSSEMLSMLYGREYAQGGATMAIFCAGLVFSAFSYIISLTLAGMRLVKLEFKIALANVGTNVLLCLLLIPAYGLEGAAAASAASFAISAAIFSYYARKAVGYRTSAQTYRLLAAGFAAFAFALLFKPYVQQAYGMLPQLGGEGLSPYLSKSAYLLLLGAATAGAFAIFALAAALLKCFEKEDAALLKSAARKAGLPSWLSSLAERAALAGTEKS